MNSYCDDRGKKYSDFRDTHAEKNVCKPDSFAFQGRGGHSSCVETRVRPWSGLIKVWETEVYKKSESTFFLYIKW